MGNASLLVLWNSKTGQPLQTITQPHKHGVIALDISHDDEWLVTVSAVDPESGEQEVRSTHCAFWHLTGFQGSWLRCVFDTC
jgi:hypothetical protein